jgi:uncharacterized MAPEG superfamily protein
MTSVLWCLLFVAIMPILLAIVGGYFRTKEPDGLDNNHPRQQIQALSGAGARAYAAQQNAWEALAIFTAAVVSAYISPADPATATQLALGFVGFRVLHAGSYLANLAVLRGVAFAGGMVCAIWLFVTGLF